MAMDPRQFRDGLGAFKIIRFGRAVNLAAEHNSPVARGPLGYDPLLMQPARMTLPTLTVTPA